MNVGEARKFLGDETYNKVFSKYGAADIKFLLASGVVFAEGNVPAIKYSNRRKFARNLLMAVINIEIRNQYEGTPCETCAEIEAKRTAEAGVKGITIEILTEIISKDKP